MQTASGEGEGDETPNVGDSMVLGVEQVGVSDRVWELGELVRFGNWIFLFLFFFNKIWFSWSVVSFSWFRTEISTPNRFSPYPLLKPNPNFSGTKPIFFLVQFMSVCWYCPKYAYPYTSSSSSSSHFFSIVRYASSSLFSFYF